MTFGLEAYSAAGNKTFTTDDAHLLVVDVVGTYTATSITKSYPELAGYTLGVVNTNPFCWSASITYPGGVPTVTVSTPGASGTTNNFGFGTFVCAVVVYIAAVPMAGGFGFWTYDVAGNPAVLNTELPTYAYSGAPTVTSTGGGSFSHSCNLLQPVYGANEWIHPPTNFGCSGIDADSFLMFDVPNSTTQSVAQAFIYGGTTASMEMVASCNGYDSSAVTPVAREFRKLGTWSTEPGGFGMICYNAAGDRVFSTGAFPLRIMAPGIITVSKAFSSSKAQNCFIDPGGGTWTSGSALPANLMCFSSTHSVAGYGYCDPFRKEKGNTIAAAASLGWQKYDANTLKLKVTNPGLAASDWYDGLAPANSPAYAFSGCTVTAFFVDRGLYI